MATKKATKKTTIKKTRATKTNNTNFFDYLRFGESYSSLVLGIIVVIIATILLLSFVHSRQFNKAPLDATPTVVQSNTFALTPTPVVTKISQNAKIYTVVTGDNLWNIAEKIYKSGYNWVDIAKANKLADPGDIHVGDKLFLPIVTPELTTVTNTPAPTATPTLMVTPTVVQTNKITNTTYTVAAGDTLWDIAVRAYGDGYQWVKIAQANNLTDPGLIHSGNVLKIPRN
ncbi:MAG TPA: LysM peptidoglycan-binding domain-containing protein [Methylomirabilota bacterium]|nr:LysM peptidoglycan-binding domain-containing protein [Methylomirabilota bacterium]